MRCIFISRVLGIDLGQRRIGLALSDPTETIARGLEVIHIDGKKDIFSILKNIVQTYDVSTIILGLPRNMDGTLGEQALKIKDFALKLEENLPEQKIDYYDERLSTREALNTLLLADISRAGRKKVIDKVSAVIILQGYLDSLKRKIQADPEK